MDTQERSWISHYIVPCSRDASCKYCKPGEPHPQQHAFSKRVTEPVASSSISIQRNKPLNMMYITNNSSIPISAAEERYLKKRKLIGSIFGNLQLIPFDPELDPEPFTCYNCWSDEHFRRDCPEPALHMYCRNCGRRDVEVHHCPRCADAYRDFVAKWEGNDKERRRLSEALYKSRQFYKEEDLCPVDSTIKKSGESEHREADDCCDFKVKNSMSQEASFREEFNSAASLTSEKILVDECWTDSDDDVYQSVEASFARESESDAKERCVKDFPCSFSENYQSVQASLESLDVWNKMSTSDAAEGYEGEFYSDPGDSDYESTRAEFIRECDSVNTDEYEQKSSSDELSFNDDCPGYSESFRAIRDAHSNELFVYIRNKKIQEELAANNAENQLKTPAESKTVYRLSEMDDDEDYDDVIVDENERSELLCSEDYAIQEFIDLLDALKHLPIEVQNVAVLHFVSERKKQYKQNQERMLHQCESEFSGL